MALSELRDRLADSIQQMCEATTLDEKTLNEITDALLDADFPILFLNEMKVKMQQVINLPAECESNKCRLIYQIISNELSTMLDPGKSAIIQGKSESIIIMFVGLKGVPKIEMCAKYARYHRKKGFRPALVCADTYRTDSFLRLHKALKDEVPVYGSYTPDPVTIVREGIEKFTKAKRDLIILDTSSRHTHYLALFQDMRLLAQATKPDLVIFVMDSSIGLAAASDQAQAFRQSFDVGVVILANIKGNSKAGGALCAVAAAKCPILLAETGEKGKEFEAFEAETFVKRLLETPWLSLEKDQYTYTLRDMYNFYMKELERDKESPHSSHSHLLGFLLEIWVYISILESMTDEELDKSNVKQLSKARMMEIAKECRIDVKEVFDMLKVYKMMAMGKIKKPYLPYRMRPLIPTCYPDMKIRKRPAS